MNDPPILAQKQQKMAIFEKADFRGLKYPLEVQVKDEICSTICGTPVPAILDHENSTGRQAGPGQVKIHYDKWPINMTKMCHVLMSDTP